MIVKELIELIKCDYQVIEKNNNVVLFDSEDKEDLRGTFEDLDVQEVGADINLYEAIFEDGLNIRPLIKIYVYGGM